MMIDDSDDGGDCNSDGWRLVTIRILTVGDDDDADYKDGAVTVVTVVTIVTMVMMELVVTMRATVTIMIIVTVEVLYCFNFFQIRI